jgi:Mg/Co/Ni transporter MgtE
MKPSPLLFVVLMGFTLFLTTAESAVFAAVSPILKRLNRQPAIVGRPIFVTDPMNENSRLIMISKEESRDRLQLRNQVKDVTSEPIHRSK